MSGALPLLLHEICTPNALRPWQIDARMQCAYARLVRSSAAVSPRNSHAPRIAPTATRRARAMRLCTARPALCRCFSMKFTRATLGTQGSPTRACNAPMHGSPGALPLFLNEIRTRHALHPRQPDARMQSAYARLVRRFAANPMRTLRRTDYLHSACACTADPLTTPYMTLFTAARVSLPVAQPSVPSSFSLSALQSS